MPDIKTNEPKKRVLLLFKDGTVRHGYIVQTPLSEEPGRNCFKMDFFEAKGYPVKNDLETFSFL